MRCPECTSRNSVAALKCTQCGARFKRKPLPMKLIGIASAVVVLVVVVLIGLAMMPAMMNPESNLQKVAKHVANGPKSAQDAERIRAELEDSVKRYLEKNTELSTKEIGDKLRGIFPSAAYEINCFDLPRNLKLVEIDTVLQPSNYLISGKHVTVLRGFEVFDAAKAIEDPSGPVLAILGHKNVQSGRHPQLRLFALLPDGVKERPSDTVPSFTGEGSAAFAKNGKDVELELSVMSRAAEEGLFTMSALASSGLKDEFVKARLNFVSGKYEFVDNNGKSALAALRAAAFVVADPREKSRFSGYLSPAALAAVDQVGKLRTCPPEFELKRLGATAAVTQSAAKPERQSRRSRRRSRRHRNEEPPVQSQPAPIVVSGPGNRYLMANTDDALEVTVAPAGGRFQVTALKRSKATAAVVATSAASDPGQAVPYEDRTSNLVDKLLSAPDPVLPAAQQMKHTAVLPAVGTAPAPVVQSDEPKVVEKQIAGEAAAIDTSSPSVKVRRGPSTGYRSITEIKKGENVEVIGKQDGWYKVRVNGKEGFVYGAFVNCKTSDAYTTATVTAGKSIKDAKNRTVSHAQPGDKLVVLGGITNDRYKVQLSDGRVGFVDKDALDVAVDMPQFVP